MRRSTVLSLLLKLVFPALRVMLQIAESLTNGFKGVIHQRNMFIVQATDGTIHSTQLKSPTWRLCYKVFYSRNIQVFVIS
jgi:hypothetical protein